MTMTHAPGTFCWVDLSTSDLAAARDFYGGLFGWTTRDMGGPGMPYWMIDLGGRDLGGMLTLPESQRAAGIPPHWLPYIAVADATATIALVREHGGASLVDPSPVGDAGFTAVVQDPQGAMFALWQPKAHPGAGARDEPGTMTWNELGTTSIEGARRFYGAVFGWTSRETPTPDMAYHQFEQDGRGVAGFYALEGPFEGVPSHWMTYFAVADCDAAAARAKALGGGVHIQPTDIPGIGRFAMLQDPPGAYFCIIKVGEMDG
jgi:uncharacterized protein